MSTATPSTITAAPARRGRRSGSAPAARRAASPARPAPKKRGLGKRKTTKTGKVKTVYTFYLYDPKIRPKPKRVATVTAVNHYKAAHKAASKGIMPQVYVRKADSALVKVYNTERRRLPQPRVVRRGNKTITFSSVPRAKLAGYFITPLFSKDKRFGVDLNHKQFVDPAKPKRRPPPPRRRSAPAAASR